MLVLVRHGQSTANAQGLLLGRSDVVLTDLGYRQAEAIGSTLDRAAEVRSSSLRRATETAAALAAGAPVVIDDRWIEVDYGEHEGRPLGEVPADVWTQWRSDPSFRPAGGETLAEVNVRVREACEELFANDGAGARGDGDIVVVSHVSPIKAAVSWALGGGPELAWRLYLGTGSVTRIGWGRGVPVLRSFNETPPPREGVPPGP